MFVRSSVDWFGWYINLRRNPHYMAPWWGRGVQMCIECRGISRGPFLSHAFYVPSFPFYEDLRCEHTFVVSFFFLIYFVLCMLFCTYVGCLLNIHQSPSFI